MHSKSGISGAIVVDVSSSVTAVLEVVISMVVDGDSLDVVDSSVVDSVVSCVENDSIVVIVEGAEEIEINISNRSKQSNLRWRSNVKK